MAIYFCNTKEQTTDTEVGHFSISSFVAIRVALLSTLALRQQAEAVRQVERSVHNIQEYPLFMLFL